MLPNHILDDLKNVVDDPSAAVASLAAETLYRRGNEELAITAFERIVEDTANYTAVDRAFVLNSVDAVNAESIYLKELVKALHKRNTEPAAGAANDYDTRISRMLLQKWGI